MANGITGFDHVLVGVDDLAAAAKLWRRLGFTLTPLGRHRGRSSGNHCIMFRNDYVELIGVVDSTQPTPPNIEILRRMGEGLIAVALASEAARISHAGFAAAGLEPLPIAELSRRVETPEGVAEIRARLVQLPAERTPECRLFVCDHLTPELIRRPEWLEHENGVLGLRSATVLASDPKALTGTQAAIFGTGAITLTDDLLTAFAGRHRLLFAGLDDLGILFPDSPSLADLRPPKGIAVGFEVDDLDRTARYLEGAGVPFDEPIEGRLQLPPAAANGVLVEFAAVS